MQEILKAHHDDPLEFFELPPEEVLAGEPRPQSKVLGDSADPTQGMTGIFAAEPGSMRSSVPHAETFHVVEGRARIEGSSGETVTLNVGDIAVLPPGDWTWTIESPLRVVFVTRPVPANEA
jgi:uncharacterized cupin superfamily protein